MASGPDTLGDNDGGSGAQEGANTKLQLSVAAGTGIFGTGTLTNPGNAIDGDPTSYCDMQVTASSPNPSGCELQLTGPAGVVRAYSSITLHVLFEVIQNNLDPASNVNWANPYPPTTVFYIAYDYGLNTGQYLMRAFVFQTVPQPLTEVVATLPNWLNPASVRVIIVAASGSNQTSGAVHARIHDAYILAVGN